MTKDCMKFFLNAWLHIYIYIYIYLFKTPCKRYIYVQDIFILCIVLHAEAVSQLHPPFTTKYEMQKLHYSAIQKCEIPGGSTDTCYIAVQVKGRKVVAQVLNQNIGPL